MGKEEVIEFVVGSQPLLGHLFRPVDRRPGVLLAHGWGGNQDSYFALARLLSALGCICVTFDFRGHERLEARRGQLLMSGYLRPELLELAAHRRVRQWPSKPC